MTPEQLTGQVQTHLTPTLVGQKEFLVHEQVSQDLLALKSAADAAGFSFNIASGFRSYQRQSEIWNNKMSGVSPILDSNSKPIPIEQLSEHERVMAILRWSALPGASRHHWGCEFDVFDRSALPEGVRLQLEPWEYQTGHQKEFYLWLSDNLSKFGFYFPYDLDRGGVAIEPWHISHVETSHTCLSLLTLDILEQQLHAAPILGLESVLSQLQQIYNQYISNVNQVKL